MVAELGPALYLYANHSQSWSHRSGCHYSPWVALSVLIRQSRLLHSDFFCCSYPTTFCITGVQLTSAPSYRMFHKVHPKIRDFNFSQKCWWISMSSGIRGCADGEIAADVSDENLSVSISVYMRFKKTLFLSHILQFGVVVIKNFFFKFRSLSKI